MNYGESPKQFYSGERLNHEKPLSPQEKDLWVRFMPQYLKQKINPEEFLDLYSPSVIQSDQKKLQEKKGQPWYREGYLRPKLLEALLWYNIEQENWLGEDVHTIVTSELDENLRGFDFVLEVGDRGISRLGIDVVLANNPEEVYKKWDENIFAYYMAAKRLDALLVRYFRSEANPKFKHWVQIPRVIVGLDSAHYDKLVSAISASKEKTIIFQEIQNLLIKEISLQIDQLLRLPLNLKEKFKKDLIGIEKAIKPLLREQKRLSWEGGDMDMVFWALTHCVLDQKSFAKIVGGEYTPQKRA